MTVYLGLGANLGDCIKNLRLAIECIKKIPQVELLRVSSFYETAAWGVTNQPNFINAAVKIRTTLEPLEFLNALQKIETDIEKIRHEHWAARFIDIDILFIDDVKINSERLTVPHKFLYERDFAMIPLAEISPMKFNLRGEFVKKIFGSPIDFKLKCVACVDKNFGIGYKGDLLFKIDEDLKNFRALTLNHTVIYGRKTLKTFPKGKPLDSRRNIIFSRSIGEVEGAEIVRNVNELWEILNFDDENFIIGGAEIFTELLPYAAEIFLTAVDEEKLSDVKFPNFNDEFYLGNREQGIGNGIEFRKYERIIYGK